MPMRFAVKAMREAMQLSVPDFAKKVGVAERTIYRWEHEGVEPSPMAIKHMRRVRAEHDATTSASPVGTGTSPTRTPGPGTQSDASASSLLPTRRE